MPAWERERGALPVSSPLDRKVRRGHLFSPGQQTPIRPPNVPTTLQRQLKSQFYRMPLTPTLSPLVPRGEREKISGGCIKKVSLDIRASDFFRHSSFDIRISLVIRHSSFV